MEAYETSLGLVLTPLECAVDFIFKRLTEMLVVFSCRELMKRLQMASKMRLEKFVNYIPNMQVNNTQFSNSFLRGFVNKL